ncbi:MAG: glycogen synthase GlgA [Melioribacteraceae bacterium]|nr:glycogen synthase GlgA [Melioribacteraceae bacterium]
MNIAFVASEVVPFAKTGGLADVSGSLPIELTKLGHSVKVFMPKYYSVDEKRFNLKHESWIGKIEVSVDKKIHRVEIFKGLLPDSKTEIYFIDSPTFFHRHSLYTNDEDEDERFILFSKAVIELLQKLHWQPNIIHHNDWQTGLIPILIKANIRLEEYFKNTATVYTIHNIAYQGNFPNETFGKAELDLKYFETASVTKENERMNFMHAGISFADVVTTVSEKYSEELQTPEFSFGMDAILNIRKDDFYGILNGIDETVWNPEVDSFIPYKYSLKTIADKEKNKVELLKKFNLPFDTAIPVVGIVSRLASQKGIDMIISSMEYLLSLDIQWVVLGSGEQQYEKELSEIAQNNPDKFSLYLGYSNELSHLIEAGSDMFLMPSQFEPCGLTQMYSLKYGTVPIVRNTGGLADTVFDWDENIYNGKEIGNGFSFNDYNGYALTDAIERAVKSFKNKKLWKKIQKNGMMQDFSWRKSAEKYIEIYKKAIAKK